MCTHLRVSRPYLKDSEEGLGEGIKGAPLGVGLVKVELAPKQLHAKQGEDDDEEKEEKQQGGDGLHGIEQRCHQIAQGCPVPATEIKCRVNIYLVRNQEPGRPPVWGTLGQKGLKEAVVLRLEVVFGTEV
jgi:hypothetical protein